MLIRFTVDNFLSFKDKSMLNLEAGSIREYVDNVFSSKIGTQDTKLLKSVFLMGANAAGKSNFLKAFQVMKNMVLNSSNTQQSNSTITPFLLNSRTADKPSTFEVIFLIDQTGYRYGFVADKNKVELEWLFTIQKRKEERIFTRTDNTIEIDRRFSSDISQKLRFVIDMTRSDSLYLSVLSQFKIDFALKISSWFQNNMMFVENQLETDTGVNAISYTAGLLKNPQYKALIYDVLKKADLGFYSIEEELRDNLAKHPNNLSVVSALYDREIGKHTIKIRHDVYNDKFEIVRHEYFDLLKDESAGSQKFIKMLGPISQAILEGKIVWIDELDSQLHTLLVNLLLNLIHKSPYNINRAQFIITTHNVKVLNKLRRDQMIMLNKDKYGASTLGSVHASKPGVRSDATFEKEYLSGALGGIPKAIQLSMDFNKDDNE